MYVLFCGVFSGYFQAVRGMAVLGEAERHALQPFSEVEVAAATGKTIAVASPMRAIGHRP